MPDPATPGSGLTERQQYERRQPTAEERQAAIEANRKQSDARYRDYCLRTCASALEAAMQQDAADPPDYDARELALLEALLAARRAGIRAGYRLDPSEPDWPVLQFELPTGQVSWHMPGHPVAWDGHDGRVKAERIGAFVVQTDNS